MASKTQSDQMVNELPLSELGSSARAQLNTLLDLINTKVKVPASLSLVGTTLSVATTEVETGPDGRKSSFPPLSGVDIRGKLGSLDLLTGTGTGNLQSVTLPTMTANYYVIAGVELRTDGNIYVIFGNEGASPAAATLPAFSDGAYHFGMAVLQAGATGGQGDWTAGTNAQITQFGAGGGGGGGGSGLGSINYIENYTADISADGWSTYNDGAATPVDGADGTVDAGFTFARTEVSPLRGKGSFLLTKPALDVVGHGVAVDTLEIPVADRGRLLEVSFDYETSSTYSDDLNVYLYDVTNGTVITPRGEKVIRHGKGRARYRFVCPGTCEQLRLMFHVFNTSTNDFTMKFDLVTLGPVFETDALKKEIRQGNPHGFSVGDVVSYNGANWSLAQATPAGYLSEGRIALVLEVINTYSFLIVEYGYFDLPVSVNLNSGEAYYLSETAGDFTTDPNQQIQVELFRAYSQGSGFWDPKPAKRVDTNPNNSFHALRFTTGAVVQFKGGSIRPDDGLPIFSGSSTAELANRNFTLDLAALVASPLDATTYWLYLDRYALGDPTTFTDTGRQALLAHSASHFVLVTTPPNEVDPYRYVEVSSFRSADTGNAWTGTGSQIVNRSEKVHNTGINLFAHPERKTITLTTATSSTVAHGLSGKPQVITAKYFDGTSEAPVDVSAHVSAVDATNITVSSIGLTFGAGEYLEVVALYHPPTWGMVSAPSNQVESAWFTDTSVTSFAHTLPDASWIRGISVLEHDVTADEYRIYPMQASPVSHYDGTSVHLDWTGFSPTANLKYKVILGGNPLPAAIQKELGGFTKFVGFGPGSYANLLLAIAAAQPGDSILVNKSESIVAPILIGVDGIKVQFMPNVKITVTTGAKGLILSGNDIDLIAPWIVGEVIGTMDSAIEVSGAGCNVTKAKVESNNAGCTITDAYKLLGGAAYNYLNGYAVATAGTITNGITDNSGMASNDWSIRV